MRAPDTLRLAAGALAGSPRRSAAIGIAVAIGVAAVVLLTALGEGGRRFVVGQFESLGTNLLVVLPGRSETVGGPPPMLGETPRDLTLDDALALARASPIREVAPIVVGAAPVSSAGGLEREMTVLGSTEALRRVRRLQLGQGRFLPRLDPGQGAPVCVLGHRARRELFGRARAYGQWVRIADRRFRVVGVLADSGVSLGVDLNDLVIVPVASAQALFDRESLFRILVEARAGDAVEAAERAIHRVITERHEGEDDVTVITQDSVLATLGRILTALTAGLASIAAVSILVAGILIMNVMLVAVAQRRAEIGLMKALGAQVSTIRRLFLVEAVLLAALGTTAGVAVGLLGAEVIARLYPALPVRAPLWALAGAVLTALGAGAVFAVAPARRAARLDPVAALARR